MKNLYAPWRANYTTGSARKNDAGQPKDSCVFCIQLHDQQDAKHFILKRFRHHVVMLNLYPYNAGHLLIISNEHCASLSELTQEARSELMEITNLCVEIVKKAFNAPGVNVGLNLGKAAGAGIPSHLHMHVLPRFVGDTNFMPTIAEVKVISFDLNEIYQQLKVYFEQVAVLP
jgi:ATP adenylyltransferase